MATSTRRIYEFLGFRLDPAERLLARDGKPVAVTPKVFDTLVFLVENAGRLITKDEFMKEVWARSFVEESTLVQSISQLRKALGDSEVIDTVPKKGYRFRGSVRTVDSPVIAKSTESIRSIAVLPFQPLARNRRDRSLELGMSDTLIARLSGIRDIIVRPISSVRRYADLKLDVLAAGSELGVDCVLEGSLQRQTNRVRVTVRLLKVSNGASLWAGIFDEEMTDIFVLQDVISERVAQALSLELSNEEKGRLFKHYTTSARAYQLYLKGRYFWWKNTTQEYKKSRDYFHRAVEEDPCYALGYCGLNSFYGFGAAWGILPPEDGWPKAEWAVTKALELDDQLAEAHLDLSALKMVYHLDWAGAEREAKRAIELNPGFDEIHYAYSFFLVVMRRFPEAVAEARRALECNPFSIRISQHVGYALYCGRNYDLAIHQYLKALELDPNDASGHEALGDAYHQIGEFRKAVEQWTKAMRLANDTELVTAFGAPNTKQAIDKAVRTIAAKRLGQLERDRESGAYVPAMRFAREHLQAGHREEALRWLALACEERNVFSLLIASDPFYDPLRDDPRFAKLLHRMKLDG
jgi:DNA-binding winged helix-turn-helix (wHTH) protein/tetratricopeptide (TPR) repeat protein